MTIARLENRTLVIASHNAGKVREFNELLLPLGFKAISATEAGVDEPEETGVTFVANAKLKSENACDISGLPCLADDSGLVVPAIGGAPGIYSARWAGPDKDFSLAFDRIRRELGDKPADAYFACVLALSVPGQPTQVFEGQVHGRLVFPPRGERGFGYDPIFIARGHDKTFGEIDPALKNSISHRAQAFRLFLDYLKEHA